MEQLLRFSCHFAVRIAAAIVLFALVTPASAQVWRQNPVLLIREGVSSDITLERNVEPAPKIAPGAYTVSITLVNHNVKGYINVVEDFGEHVTVLEKDYCPCLSKVEDNSLKFKWLHLPKGEAITLTYTLQIPAGIHPEQGISGGVFYHRNRAMPTTGPFVSRPRYLSTTPNEPAEDGRPGKRNVRKRKYRTHTLPPF